METLIYGFYLVMITITPMGDVRGEVMNYFTDANACIEHGIWEEENAPYGIGFVCIEDVETPIIEQDLEPYKQD